MRVLFYDKDAVKVAAEVSTVKAFTLNNDNHFTFEVDGCTYTFVALRFFNVSEFLSSAILDFTEHFRDVNNLQDASPEYTFDKDFILTED